MPVNAAVALFHAVRVPRYLVVDQPVAVQLEVDAFGRRVRGKQNANRADVGRSLERGFDALAFVCVHTAVERHQPIAGRQAFGC